MNQRVNLRNPILGLLLTVAAARGAPPEFREIYGLVRSNLAGVNQAQLDEAAVKGLLNEFPGRVMVEDAAGPGETNAPGKPLSKTAVYDGSYAYFRVASVSSDLPAGLRQAWDTVADTNKGRIKGVVLDLRFADGQDYAAAGAVADCFLPVGESLLEWPGGLASSVKKGNAITAPVAILLNAKTSGAAEALAAVLRATDRSLTVGAKTAGQAALFTAFPLSNGQTIRIATGEIKLAGGPSLAGGLTPDILVESTPELDKGYMENPYKEPKAPEAVGTANETNTADTARDQPVRRFNEAELVREQRAGLNPGEELMAAPTGAPGAAGPPTILDPTLARALDLLKGLSVLSGGKPG